MQEREAMEPVITSVVHKEIPNLSTAFGQRLFDIETQLRSLAGLPSG